METMQEQPEWGKKLSRACFIPQRVIMAVMAFFSILINYTMRICLSVTITRLVAYHAPLGNKTSSAACPADPDLILERTEADGMYHWSQYLQGYILGSYYIGYVLGHLPAGLMSEKWGAKWVLTGGIFNSAFFTLLTPISIKLWGPWALFTVRIIIGFSSGFSYPCCTALLAHWVPIQERSLIGSFVMGGSLLGVVVGNGLSGLILKYSAWEWVFYTFGTAAILWIIFFVILCYSDPRSHPFISEKEKEFLLLHMGRLGRELNLPPTPWKPIFKNKAVWALIIAQISHDWGFYVMISDLPKYMNEVLHFPILKNGAFSSIPFVFMWVFSLLFGAIADVIIKRNRNYATMVRIVFTAVDHYRRKEHITY